MKIKEILIESFKSPFANLLAIANISMFAIVESLPLSRGHNSFTMLVHQANAPAILAAIGITGSNEMSVLMPPLIYMQWIFVAAFARSIRFYVAPTGGQR